MAPRTRVHLLETVLVAALVATLGGCRAPGPEAAGPPASRPSTPATGTVPPATAAPPEGPCPPATVTVGTADDFRAALSAAEPGAVIELLPGVYEGRFVATAAASDERPIHLCGPRSAVLDGGATETGVTL